MSKCKSCGAEMKPLWLMTSLFCPNECDLKRNPPREEQDSGIVVVYFPRNSSLETWRRALRGSIARGRTPKFPFMKQPKGILYYKNRYKHNDYEIHVEKKYVEWEGVAVLDATVGNAPVVRVKPGVPVLDSDHPMFKPCK